MAQPHISLVSPHSWYVDAVELSHVQTVCCHDCRLRQQQTLRIHDVGCLSAVSMLQLAHEQYAVKYYSPHPQVCFAVHTLSILEPWFVLAA